MTDITNNGVAKTIHFTKYHGIGNDFVITDADNVKGQDLSDLAKRLCKRNFGIGADGLIVATYGKNTDWKMTIYNSDGSYAEMCGNGLRCFVKYLCDRQLIQGQSVAVETGAGVKTVSFYEEQSQFYAVADMGEPSFSNEDNITLDVSETPLTATLVSMGNPHCVIFVDNIDSYPWMKMGKTIENLPLFPDKTNVEFVQVIDKNYVKVVVWERGAGATLACGTGACAVLAAGVKTGVLQRKATLELPGGKLHADWRDDGHIYLSGPAEKVFEGNIKV